MFFLLLFIIIIINIIYYYHRMRERNRKKQKYNIDFGEFFFIVEILDRRFFFAKGWQFKFTAD